MPRAPPTPSRRAISSLQQTARQEQTRAASQFLQGEIERLRKDVAGAEAKVEQYRAKTNLFIGNNNTTLSNQQLGDFNAQLGAARAQRTDAESRAHTIRDALRRGAPAEFSDIINSEVLRRLSDQHVDAARAACRAVVDACSDSIRASRN